MTTHKLFNDIARALDGLTDDLHRHKSHLLPSPTGRNKSRLGGEGVGLRLGVGLLLILLASCARMGRPDGGWYDETPPHVIATDPADGGTGAKPKKVHILFDEFIKLDNASEKVVVSPPQMEQAEVKATGKRIEVELKDSLRSNTTYTIDFSDAISDNNEGNPLGNYTYSFSTGDHIDTLQVAGCVLQADNLEPVKGTLVGLYGELDDSCFIKKPMLRVARTDSRGHFVIRGVAPGNYRIYALQDQDGDYRFSQKSEQIAFSRDTISPSFRDAVRQDTAWTDSLHIKSITRVGYTRFTPDDIVLRAFSEPVTDRFLLKAERAEADRFTMFFSYGDSMLPELRPLNFNGSGAFLIEPSARRDTVTYWLRDTALVNLDTLSIAATYRMTDTLGCLVTQTDTLQILSRQPYAKRMKDAQKEYEDWHKKQEKKRKRGEPYDSVMPRKTLMPQISSVSSLDPDRNIRFSFPRPLAVADTSKIHLYAKYDTLWYVTPLRFAPVEMRVPGDTARADATPSLREYELRAEWRPDAEYSIELDSMAFVDIYGNVSPAMKMGAKVRSLDEYSSLLFSLTLKPGERAVVELLNQQGEPVKKAAAEGDEVQFFYVTPGKYYARMLIDDNGNGVWDTGDYAAGRQPEMVYYYPEEIECKAKWDVTLNWNPTARPLDRQKPAQITKQKAEMQRKIQQRNRDRARKMGIPYTAQQP